MRDTILTQPAATQGLRHDRTTIILHWTTAVLVAVLWIIGQTIDIFPNGPLRIDYRSIHIVCGVLLGVLLGTRLIWRLTRRESLPPIDHGALLFIARFTHWMLYALLFVAIGLGVAYLWVRGNSIFNLFQVPAYDPANRRALSHQVGGWHALAANTILVVAGLHAAAALFHHFILRDATLSRMLPWRLR